MSTGNIQIQANNLAILTALLGSLQKTSIESGVNYSAIIGVNKGKKLTPRQCGQLEEAFALPAGWVSTPHERASEEEALQRLPRFREISHLDKSGEVLRQEIRWENVSMLVGSARGSKTAFCQRVGLGQADYLKLKKVGFSSKRARNIEASLYLPDGWLDIRHSDVPPLPDDFKSRLGLFQLKDAPASIAVTVKIPSTSVVALSGNCRPIARALIETLIRQANSGELTEVVALTLLNQAQSLQS